MSMEDGEAAEGSRLGSVGSAAEQAAKSMQPKRLAKTLGVSPHLLTLQTSQLLIFL